MNWRNWLESVKFSVLFANRVLYVLQEIENFPPQPLPKDMKMEQDLEIQWEMQKEVIFYNRFAPRLLFGVGKNCCCICKARCSQTWQL